MTVLKCEQIFCGYHPGKPVLKGVSFSIEEGEFAGIVGPNGSGKTTLLRALAGLVAIDSGNIILSHHNMAHLDRQQIARKIAFVPQLMEPVEGFSVEELVMLGRTPYFDRFSFEKPDDHDAVAWAIKELMIEDLASRPSTDLSGGEFQRVAIARALAQEPRVLLLDEPISHLDIRYQVKICKLLRKLRTRRSIIATFHDLNIASRFCSYLILMKDGAIIAEGTPDKVVTPENIWKAYRIKVKVRSNPDVKKAKYVLLP